MKLKLELTMLALSLGLPALTVSAQPQDLGPDTGGYRRFLLYPHLDRAFEAQSRGDRATALSEFEQARALAPDNPVMALHLAHALRRFNNPARAEAVLREQLARNPGNARLISTLAELQSAMARPVELAAVSLPPPTGILPGSATPGRPPAGGTLALQSPAPKPAAALPRSSAAPAARPRQPATAASRRADAAYAFADKAYKASARGDHEGAARAAREAVRLAPGNRAYLSLLVYELSETGQLEQADAAASQAPPGMAAGGGGDELAARQKMIRQHIAFKSFDQANKAALAGDAEAAAQASRKGAEYAPELLAHRLQLVGLLLRAKKWPEAEQAANDALRDLGERPALLTLRAHALQQQGQRPAASADLDNALAAAGLAPSDQQNLRLIAVDAALAASEPKKALDLLEPQMAASGSTPDEGVASRRALAFQAFRRSAVAGGSLPPAWVTPKVVCVGDSLSASCEVWPGENPPDPAFPVADAAYKAYGARDYGSAAGKAREALQISPGNPQYRLLLVNALMAGGQMEHADEAATGFLVASAGDGEMLALRSRVRQRRGQEALAAVDAENALRASNLSVGGEAGMLVQLNRKAQAREVFNAALQSGELAGQPEVDTAYLAVQVGDDAAAVAAFERASSARTLPDPALQDAAYAAGRLGRNEESVDYFRRAIDVAQAGQLPLTPQQMFTTRRSVADRTRKTGVYGSLTYRGIASSGLSLNPGATDDTLQAGLEAYWRPFGYGDGRLLELYGGLLGTLYSKADLPTGAPTVQGALGARVKPLTEANLILALERRLGIGSLAQSDWLARIGYSWDKGLDLRADVPQWWTAQVYAEAGRFIKLKQNYSTFEGQAGRSFRLDAIHPKLVVFPHLVLGADRNTGYEKGHEKAVGAGVGVNLRYWFNEDRYSAPRSYWDASLQYRGRISGDERAKGVFFRVTLSY
ncbi:MAG: hypothetical protein JWP96_682 [Polaromonas sp.]|nr:hypothetical protein [Polaromonas sp.]